MDFAFMSANFVAFVLKYLTQRPQSFSQRSQNEYQSNGVRQYKTSDHSKWFQEPSVKSSVFLCGNLRQNNTDRVGFGTTVAKPLSRH
ncbi:MAG: hypothetical protein FWH27_05775 [Planctomycetaceae bacterium]|nr:hypothetical protein [Planctomycetaceae bacterium]